MKLLQWNKAVKKYLTILLFSLLSFSAVFAQEDDPVEDNSKNKLQQRMQQYIQKRLGLSTAEAERFSPLFIRYMIELRKTHRDFKMDRPMQQYKVAELRIRFRNEFRQILDEQRANKIYEYQREFEQKVRQELMDRRRENLPQKRFNN